MQTEGGVYQLTKAEQAYIHVLFEESRSKIRRAISRHLYNINKDSIDDMIQETFVRACENFKSMSAYDSAEAWLLSTAHHVALDEVKRCIRLSELKENMVVSLDSAPEELLVPDVTAVSVPYHVLSEESRELLNRYYRDGKTSEEIAEELGIKPATVRKRLERIRKTLKAEIIKYFCNFNVTLCLYTLLICEGG